MWEDSLELLFFWHWLDKGIIFQNIIQDKDMGMHGEWIWGRGGSNINVRIAGEGGVHRNDLVQLAGS